MHRLREVALPMTPLDRLKDDRAQSNTRLSRIAVALGKHENVFLEKPEALGDLDDTIELLRAWNSLKHSVDRRKALESVQSMVAKFIADGG